MKGPYTRKCGPDKGRKVVILYDDNGNKIKGQYYSRYLMEQKLGRELATNEEVDHIDEDKTNDDINNLQVLIKAEHKDKHARFSKYSTFNRNCIACDKEMILNRDQFMKLLNRIKQGKTGPFCTLKCSGKYSKQVH